MQVVQKAECCYSKPQVMSLLCHNVIDLFVFLFFSFCFSFEYIYRYRYMYYYMTIHMYSGITSGRVLDGELLYTKILEVNLFAFAYRLFHTIKQSVGKCKQINF